MILSGFIKKEFLQTLRDPRLGVMVLVAPVLQIIFFGFALTNDVLNISLGSYFSPSDVVANDIYKAALASKRFKFVDVSDVSPEKAIQNGVAEAVLVAPEKGLTSSSGHGDGELQLLINASNALRARAIEGYLQSIVQTVCFPEVVSPLKISVRTLYNPTLETTSFMVPGIMAMLLLILVMILTCTSIAKEKESGTFEAIIAAPIKRSYIILGKTVPFALMGLLNTFVILIFALIFFDMPFRGSFLVLLLENLFFVNCSVLLGILLSTFVNNQQQAMLCCFIAAFVLMMLSGSFFPIENMPLWLRCVAYMNPMAHHTFLLRNILLKGGDTLYIIKHIFAIFLSSSVIAIYAFKRFKMTLN
jgi:ABC-2 type transport system permease protein